MAASNMLDLLRLFSLEVPAWRAEGIASALGVSVATAYRYIAHLQRAGLVDSSAHGYYTLGPAFIEFDRLIRTGDPMLKAATPRMQSLRRRLRVPCTVQLWRCYRDCVVLVHETQSDQRRGKVVSLFHGAPSQVILAALPTHVLRRLFRKRTAEIRNSKLGRTWPSFGIKLRAIHAAGWCAGRSLLGTGTAVASAVCIDGTVLGSVSVELHGRRSQQSLTTVGNSVKAAAARIAAAVDHGQKSAARRKR